MNLNIGEKIIKHRKLLNLTQEQIADILGVSNAAVSKWESGISYPDITLLPKIALLFSVSIDSLLGFDIQNESLLDIRNQAKKLFELGRYGELIEYLEGGLLKYPNDYELNLLMARALVSRGLNSTPQNKEFVESSLKYYDKAILLNSEESNIDILYQNKSFALQAIGEYKESNKLLKSLDSSKYIVEIANNLIKMEQFSEAKNMLLNYLNDFMFSFSWFCSILKECFKKEGKDREAYMLVEMNAHFREYMTFTEKPNYYNSLSSKDFLDLAIEAKKNRDEDNFYYALEKSIIHAITFDSEPNYEVERVNFLSSLNGSYSGSNASASKYLKKVVKEKFKEFSDNERFISLTKKLESQ